MALTNNDLKKIGKVMDQKLFVQNKRFDNKLSTLEKNLKAYIHDAADTIVNGFDEIFKGHATDESYPHDKRHFAWLQS